MIQKKFQRNKKNISVGDKYPTTSQTLHVINKVGLHTFSHFRWITGRTDNPRPYSLYCAMLAYASRKKKQKKLAMTGNQNKKVRMQQEYDTIIYIDVRSRANVIKRA